MRVSPHPSSVLGRLAFSLLEIMVAVSLLAAIIVALLLAFQQAQRAFRTGVSQVDVLESGRATMALLARELQELTPSGLTNSINFYAGPPDAPILVQPLPTDAWTNVLQELFFLTHYNDDWISTKYAFQEDEWATGVATLYRKINSASATNIADITTKNFALERTGVDPNFSTDFHRVAEGIVHFRFQVFDPFGNPITPTNNPLIIVTNVLPNAYESYRFYYTNLPAYVDLELGILEPQTLKSFRARASVDPTSAMNFLTNRVGKVHLFRQRIPIRTASRLSS